MEIVQVLKVNETYIKIIAEPGLIMEMSERFTFDVPGAKFTPAYKSRYWDGKIRLLNTMTCLLYVGLLRYVESFCKSRGYEVEHLSDFNSTEFSIQEAKEFVSTLNLTMQPRDYQLATFAHAVREKRALMLSPTASGKSFIIYLITRYYAKRTLIIVPTTSLVSQLASDFADYGFEGYVHKITGGEEKDPIFVTFTCENGIKYTFDSNENIKIINGNIKYKKAKDITEDDEIDDRWLSK